MLKGKVFMVTGATGFVGACLARRLVGMGCDTHVLIRKDADMWRISDISDSLSAHAVDLEDKDGVASAVGVIRPDVIFHLAAYGGYHFQADPLKSISTNVIGSFNLLDACARHGFDSFVNTGSSSEYGLKDAPMRETDVLEPASYYAVTKSCATLLCQMEAKNRGLPINTVRLFSAYGCFEAGTRLVPTVIKACLTAKDPRLLSPASVRDFIFVEDAIDLFLKLAESRGIAGQIFNAGSGRQHTTAELVRKVIGLTNARIEPLWESAEARPTAEPANWVADISKAKKMLGWEPAHSLDEGLEKTIRWFEQNLRHYG